MMYRKHVHHIPSLWMRRLWRLYRFLEMRKSATLKTCIDSGRSTLQTVHEQFNDLGNLEFLQSRRVFLD
jgi:hypothetical protein